MEDRFELEGRNAAFATALGGMDAAILTP